MDNYIIHNLFEALPATVRMLCMTPEAPEIPITIQLFDYLDGFLLKKRLLLNFDSKFFNL